LGRSAFFPSRPVPSTGLAYAACNNDNSYCVFVLKIKGSLFQFSFCDYGDFVEKLLLAVVIELFEHTVASSLPAKI
jgi:hypothetical protein